MTCLNSFDVAIKLCKNYRLWRILEHRRVVKQLSCAVPVEVLRRYEKWKDIARVSGPMGLRAMPGFHDAALSGDWKGHRSSRLGLHWRVIYCIVASELQVYVLEVTAHDYGRN
jgi:toxin HigB-1